MMHKIMDFGAVHNKRNDDGFTSMVLRSSNQVASAYIQAPVLGYETDVQLLIHKQHPNLTVVRSLYTR